MKSQAELKAEIEARVKKGTKGSKGNGGPGNKSAKKTDGYSSVVAGRCKTTSDQNKQLQHYNVDLERSRTGSPRRKQQQQQAYDGGALSSRMERGQQHAGGSGLHSSGGGNSLQRLHAQQRQHPGEWRGQEGDMASQFGNSIRQRAREVGGNGGNSGFQYHMSSMQQPQHQYLQHGVGNGGGEKAEPMPVSFQIF